MKLRQTWRWFGPDDPVTLQDVLQTGAQGIVTALHHVPHGEVWTIEEIQRRKEIIEAKGLTWDVVESVTIHEDIKTRSGRYLHWIDCYKQTLSHLAACGIRIVTYNFMPVNDWTRTSLDHPMRDGSLALYFNWADMAMFDIHLLQRRGAVGDYPASVVAEASRRFEASTPTRREHLANVVMFGIPGERKSTIPEMREKLAAYRDIDRKALRENLAYFLSAIAPVADELGIRLAIHPDDPPYDILGLPRIVRNMDDYQFILDAVPARSNGACFCTGSLGASFDNDLPEMARRIGDKVHFVHLRNVRKDPEGNFYEDDHLGGDVDMYAVLQELLEIQQRKGESIPFRPDHGHQMIDDLKKTTNPGYSCIGRLRGLAELRGLEMGIVRSRGWEG
ncbi:MAG: mannonate dehydratase [Bacteroidetes bacterium]|nr:mannonate dehydratase [Bacteroidota bacterium]